MQVNIGDVLTSAAILVALATWWLTYQRQRMAERDARTADIVANLSTSSELADAVFHVTRLINAGQQVPYDGIDEATERRVVSILDYYEYMCELYESGILSRKTIANLRGRLMVRTFQICETYILETRRRQGRTVYESFERFVKSFPPDPTPLPSPPEPQESAA